MRSSSDTGRQKGETWMTGFALSGIIPSGSSAQSGGFPRGPGDKNGF